MKSEWINVRDNRPMNEQRVLLYVKNIERNSELISIATYILEPSYSVFDDSYVGCFDVDVRRMIILENGERFYIIRDIYETLGEAEVYWMDLPEPPKVGD